MNQFREQRVVGGIPGELDSPVTERHIESVTLPIDGVDVPAMRIDSDPHVYALAGNNYRKACSRLLRPKDVPLHAAEAQLVVQFVG